MPFLDDLATLCIAGSAGTVVGTDIFIGSKAVLPDGSSAFLTITSTGGLSPERTQNEISPPAWRRPTAQIVARAKDSIDAETLIEAAWNAVQGKRNVLINSVRYREIDPTQEPFDLGLDTEDRARQVFNVSAIKNP